MKAAPTLARRLSVSIAWMLAGAVAFIATASSGIDKLIELEIKSRIPARLVHAIDQLDRNEVPSNADMLALLKTMSHEQMRAVVLSYAGVALLSLIVIIVYVWLARRLGARFAAPIIAVADGAKKIGAGDFGHRIVPPPKLTRELQGLVDGFNAQAEALERSERRMRFQTASIAHELRTPLTVLSGYIQGALDGVFPRDDAHMRALLTQVNDLSRIIDDLRTVSLASTGALALEVADCDLAGETASVLHALASGFAAAGMRLEMELAPALVRADPARVRQMLRAVLENARRYAAEGGRLTVRTFVQDDECVLRIEDRGPGFPADHRAFEGFWRADLSRTRATGGSGLGLSVVKALADAHGGEVSISNRRNGGARIEIRFFARDEAVRLAVPRLAKLSA
ncbi:ATP-binding protein [Caulobacter sp. RL271]|uniref:histidine kinase n=1 Tax=Caulobacter segnis TaxID=88688 RepID=A0ABY4ZYJ0_9CAUL|nr:ATP-binding protein [Caulobacter segnis]USQ97570.1 ATP-binding protein [Caulobacter segnis]